MICTPSKIRMAILSFGFSIAAGCDCAVETGATAPASATTRSAASKSVLFMIDSPSFGLALEPDVRYEVHAADGTDAAVLVHHRIAFVRAGGTHEAFGHETAAVYVREARILVGDLPGGCKDESCHARHVVVGNRCGLIRGLMVMICEAGRIVDERNKVDGETGLIRDKVRRAWSQFQLDARHLVEAFVNLFKLIREPFFTDDVDVVLTLAGMLRVEAADAVHVDVRDGALKRDD